MALNLRLSSMARALRHRNYRLFFAGQSISLIGTWVTKIATSWLVYKLTDSPWLLGLVTFASQVPSLLLSPLAGVWIDRANTHRVLLVTQVLAMLQSGLLAYFALTETIDVPSVLALSLFQGLINVVDMPARQSFLVEMIEDRQDLPNAIALNSSMVNMARLLGPSLAGLLITAFGEGLCFTLDSLSYVAVIASLLAMRVSPRAVAIEEAAVWSQLKEGFLYVARFPPIRAVLVLLTLTSIAGAPYTLLTPVLAREVLHGQAGMLGMLMAASGLGALGAALYLASRATVLGLGRVIAGSTAVFGASLIALGLSRSFVFSLLLMFASGLCMMLQMAATNTILQTVADEDKRGRVMGFYTVAVFGTVPIGSLLAGALAERVGTAETLVLGGGLCLFAALCFARTLPRLRAILRPVYQRLGILPAPRPLAR
ncbi:MAG: MFS transporter [Myxococcales bacterium]